MYCKIKPDVMLDIVFVISLFSKIAQVSEKCTPILGAA